MHIVGWIAAGIGIVFISTLLILCVCNRLLSRWACDIMGWHYVDIPANINFDGCSFIAKCSRCGKYVLQDSQGNWF